MKKHLEEDEKEKGGGKHTEINLRTVYVMRSIGAGHASLGKMCCHLNMPEPMNSKTMISYQICGGMLSKL